MAHLGIAYINSGWSISGSRGRRGRWGRLRLSQWEQHTSNKLTSWGRVWMRTRHVERPILRKRNCFDGRPREFEGRFENASPSSRIGRDLFDRCSSNFSNCRLRHRETRWTFRPERKSSQGPHGRCARNGGCFSNWVDGRGRGRDARGRGDDRTAVVSDLRRRRRPMKPSWP